MSCPLIFVYDIGVPVRMTEKQLETWTREAEEGYDVDALKRRGRGRGRPGRSATPSRVVAVRLTDHEMRVLDNLAASQSLSRSETLRRALMRPTHLESPTPPYYPPPSVNHTQQPMAVGTAHSATDGLSHTDTTRTGVGGRA